MAFLTTLDSPPDRSSEGPHIEPAWILLGTVFAVLLAAALWSDHVVDQSLEDWGGNVRHHGTEVLR